MRPIAECWIDSYAGHTAACFANVSGTILPFEMPSKLLRSLDLHEGDRFSWSMAADGRVKKKDIQPISGEPSLSPEEEAEFTRLWESMKDEDFLRMFEE